MTRLLRSTQACLCAMLSVFASGCVIDFGGLADGESGGGGTGGEGGAGAGGGSASLCAPCVDGVCTPVARSEDPQLPIARVSGISGGLAFSDPLGTRLGVIDAGGLREIVTTLAPHALTTQGDTLIYATQSQGIFRCGLPGCDDLAELVPMSQDTFARQLVADADQLFWITGPDISSGTVFRCDVDACNPIVVADLQNRPHALVIDETHLYWTVHGSGGSDDGFIRRAAKSGGPAEDYLTNVVAPSGLAATADALVFTQGSLQGDVWQCDRSGDTCGTPTRITDGPSPVATPIHTPMSVAVLDGRAVWTNDGDTTVMSCPLAGCSTDGGTPHIVARDLAFPRGITVAAGCVAWSASAGIYSAAP